jgi:hypothetical protein
MFIKPNFYGNAISNLLPEGTGFAMAGAMEWNTEVDSSGNIFYTTPKNIEVFDKNVSIPFRAEIEAEVARLEAEWENTEYQRLRRLEYPSMDILADALFWQQQGDNSKMEAYLAAVQEIKNKYPKG